LSATRGAERRTCLIEVILGTSKGHLIFCYEELVKATCGDLEGDDSVYEMLGWESPALVINDYEVTELVSYANQPL